MKKKITRFDVPAHKSDAHLYNFNQTFGNKVMEHDTNSSPELDNLTNPKTILKDAETRAAELFQVDNAKFLVNGTTIGIQAMLLATVKENEKIIVPTNIHKSVYNALILSG